MDLDDSISSAPLLTPSSPSISPKRRIRSRLWPLILLLILTNTATSLYTLPLNRVVERRLCREHYGNQAPGTSTETGAFESLSLKDWQSGGEIPEKLCKIDEVQKRLAWIQGVMETTAVVCGM